VLCAADAPVVIQIAEADVVAELRGPPGSLRSSPEAALNSASTLVRQHHPTVMLLVQLDGHTVLGYCASLLVRKAHALCNAVFSLR
jgi:hypothetical protein